MNTIPTLQSLQTFRPTPEMIRAAENVILCMAHVDCIRPIVEGYQRRILAELKPKVKIEYHERLHLPEQVITEPKQDYLMGDEDFQIYLARCHEEMAKAGLKVERPGDCPLLVAMHLQCEAEEQLIDVMAPITTIEASQVWLEKRETLLQIILSLVGPFCASAKEILNRFGFQPQTPA